MSFATEYYVPGFLYVEYELCLLRPLLATQCVKRRDGLKLCELQ
jgi:hypothetical protein